MFVHSVRVRPLDCDRQGVVGHPRYLHFFEAALLELWREAIGPFEETRTYGIDLAVAELNVRYYAPCRFDDVLDIGVIPRDVGPTSAVFRFDTRVRGGLAVRCETRYVPIGIDSGTKQPLPDAISKAFMAYAAD